MKFNIVKGDIFDYIGVADCICVTTNGVVKRNGELVMGAGVAKAFADKFTNISFVLGYKVKKYGNHVFQAGYYHNKTAVLSFPTKHHYSAKADLDLIIQSANRLVKWANQNNAKSIIIPSPGTGLGGLDKTVVYDALSNILDERFTIITK